jgi:hypothetical protein
MCDRVLMRFQEIGRQIEIAVQMYHHKTFIAKINLQQWQMQMKRKNRHRHNLNKRHHISILAYFRT